MTDLTGKWTDNDGVTGSITDDSGKLTLTPGNAPWSTSYGAWGQNSAQYEGKGDPKAGLAVFTFANGQTDTESFEYDAANDTLTFANKRKWSR